MKNSIRAVFFDAGNTLIFPHLEVLTEDLTGQGYPASAEDFYAAERVGKARLDEWLWPQIRGGKIPPVVDTVYWQEYLKTLLERIGAPDGERARLTGRVGNRFRDIKLWSRVFPDTSPLLEELHREGFVLGVISNSVGLMEEHLRRLGLAKHFNCILDSAIVGVEKPHPEIFQMALTRVGVGASEAIFVGDTYATDVGGARLAGLQGVLIDRVGAYSNVDCPRITSLPQIQPILNG